MSTTTIIAPGPAARLEAVLHRHQPQRLYQWDVEGGSYDDFADAVADGGPDAQITYFEICRCCGDLEMANTDDSDEVGYADALWPCATAQDAGVTASTTTDWCPDCDVPLRNHHHVTAADVQAYRDRRAIAATHTPLF